MKNAGDLDGALKGKDSDYMELQNDILNWKKNTKML